MIFFKKIKTVPEISTMDICCHVGGPKILTKVGETLGLPDPKDQLRASYGVMTQHGNVSGASNLAVLDHYNRELRKEPEKGRGFICCLAMGPGVCLEGLILKAETGDGA